MTQDEFRSLKEGNVIRLSPNGRDRLVLRAGKGSVVLEKVSLAEKTLWSGQRRKGQPGDTTTYALCDCKNMVIVSKGRRKLPPMICTKLLKLSWDCPASIKVIRP